MQGRPQEEQSPQKEEVTSAPLRPYIDDDLDRLIEIVRAHLEDSIVSHIGPWEASEAMLRAELPTAGDDVQVLEIDGDISAFVWIETLEECLFLEEIHVVESARGLGYGLRLMNYVEAEARARGRRQVQLTVFQESPQVAFYERLGYRIIGEAEERHQLRLAKDVG